MCVEVLRKVQRKLMKKWKQYAPRYGHTFWDNTNSTERPWLNQNDPRTQNNKYCVAAYVSVTGNMRNAVKEKHVTRARAYLEVSLAYRIVSIRSYLNGTLRVFPCRRCAAYVYYVYTNRATYRLCKYVTRLLEIVYPEMVYTDDV